MAGMQSLLASFKLPGSGQAGQSAQTPLAQGSSPFAQQQAQQSAWNNVALAGLTPLAGANGSGGNNDLVKAGGQQLQYNNAAIDLLLGTGGTDSPALAQLAPLKGNLNDELDAGGYGLPPELVAALKNTNNQSAEATTRAGMQRLQRQNGNRGLNVPAAALAQAALAQAGTQGANAANAAVDTQAATSQLDARRAAISQMLQTLGLEYGTRAQGASTIANLDVPVIPEGGGGTGGVVRGSGHFGYQNVPTPVGFNGNPLPQLASGHAITGAGVIYDPDYEKYFQRRY